MTPPENLRPHAPGPWQTVWSSDDAANLRIETQQVDDEAGPWTMHRVCVGRSSRGSDAGAVVIAVRRQPRRELLLVRQFRPAPGVELWEFPRGLAEPEDRSAVDTALRELAEETGFAGTDAVDLGVLYPDSGLLAGQVGIVLATVSGDAHQERDGEVDAVGWFSEDELAAMIAHGQVRDGITLSAAMIAAVAGRLRLPGAPSQP